MPRKLPLNRLRKAFADAVKFCDSLLGSAKIVPIGWGYLPHCLKKILLKIMGAWCFAKSLVPHSHSKVILQIPSPFDPLSGIFTFVSGKSTGLRRISAYRPIRIVSRQLLCWHLDNLFPSKLDNWKKHDGWITVTSSTFASSPRPMDLRICPHQNLSCKKPEKT